MINSIWVGMNDDGYIVASDEKLVVTNKGLITGIKNPGAWVYAIWLATLLNLELQPNEIVKVQFDTGTSKITVKRERGKGWYLMSSSGVPDNGGIPFACHWDGNEWVCVPNKDLWKKMGKFSALTDSELTVIYKLPDCEYLRGLE